MPVSRHKDRVIAIKILILAGDTDGNLGDLAIVTATCEELRKPDPGARIALLTSHPERDSHRLGIVPIRRGWRGIVSLARWARQSDLVICGGGGLFQDDDSLVKMPYWALRLAAVRLLARRIAGLSIGAGPLRHPLSRVCGRMALKTLDPISVRDRLARDVLQPLTHKRVQVVPDPAFLLQAAPEAAARQALESAGVPPGKRLVGVSVRRWFHTRSNIIPHKYAAKLGLHRNRGRSTMRTFTTSVAKALDEVARESDAHIVFLPTYNLPHENDGAVCEAIAADMKAAGFSILTLDEPKLYKAVTGCLSVMLCGRMHPAILAAGQGTPVVGLAYNQKFLGVFELLGQQERCLSLQAFVGSDNTALLSAMLLDAIREPSRIRPDTTALETTAAQFIGTLIEPLAVGAAAAAQPQTR